MFPKKPPFFEEVLEMSQSLGVTDFFRALIAPYGLSP